jgi:hypothetical protein
MIMFTGTSLQLHLIITAHTSNSFRCRLRSIYEESLTNLGLISTPRIHECTAFYICHAALIQITDSKGSITVLHECVVSETMY